MVQTRRFSIESALGCIEIVNQNVSLKIDTHVTCVFGQTSWNKPIMTEIATKNEEGECHCVKTEQRVAKWLTFSMHKMRRLPHLPNLNISFSIDNKYIFYVGGKQKSPKPMRCFLWAILYAGALCSKMSQHFSVVNVNDATQVRPVRWWNRTTFSLLLDSFQCRHRFLW